MALVPVTQPYTMNNAKFDVLDPETGLPTGEYSDHVSQVQFDPSVTRASWTAISGYSITGQSAPTWTCTTTQVQDLAPGSFARFLHDNAGTERLVRFTPTDGAEAIDAMLVLAPGTLGGSAGADAQTSSVTHGVNGSPVFVDVNQPA